MHPDVVLASGAETGRRRKRKGFTHFFPMSLYLLAFYIGIALYVPFAASVRSPLFSFGNYALSWVEVFFVGAAMIGILEMLKVAEPKVNNTMEAWLITLAWVFGFLVPFIVGFVLWLAGAKIAGWDFGIFSNTEFFVLTFIFGVQSFAAFQINGATLQVQVTNQ